MVTNGLNMGLLQWAWFEKTVNGIEIYWLFRKEKVSGAVVSKEGDNESLLRHERQINIDFVEIGATINIASNSLGKIHLMYWMTPPT